MNTDTDQNYGAGTGFSPAIADAAEALLGTGWRRDLAFLLGPHHPDGARESLDPRLVRRWLVGTREIPDWVPVVLADLLREEASHMLTAAGCLQGPRGDDPQL